MVSSINISAMYVQYLHRGVSTANMAPNIIATDVLIAAAVVLVSSSSSMAFSTRRPPTNKLSTSYVSIFSSPTLQYQQPLSTSTLISYGSLRDLVSSSDDDNTNSRDGSSVNADDRTFGLSYSKYSDTSFRSRNVFGTGSNDDTYDEEAGLNADRLSTFSFASNSQQSGSQGILSGEDDLVEEDTSKDLDLDISAAKDKEELDTDDIKQQQNTRSTELAADNFMNAVGINYSKRSSFPSREINEVSDEKDEKGLHRDRLSTFSFSTSQQPSSLGPRAVNKKQPTQQQVGKSDDDESQSPSTPSDQLGVDNFHGNINLNVRKDTAPANRSVPAEGLDNHYDRLSTYSKGQRPGGDVPSSEVRKVSKGSGGVNPSLSNDRLGTFSFGNVAPNSGSTSSQGTSASNPNESIKPPQYEKQEEPQIKSNQFDKIDQVFSQASSEKGSLSSLASSVSVKTRSERIKDIKKATDPRLLHPDGQDVPRLNSKGDVMSFSRGAGQRPSIFERIELANEDFEGAEDEEGGDKHTDKEKKDVYSVDDSEYDGGNLILDKDDDTDDDDDSAKGNGDCFLGFDLGTSGARMSIVENKVGRDSNCEYKEVVTEALSWDDMMQYDNANSWNTAIDILLSRVGGTEIMTRVKALCVSGTSASCLLVDRQNHKASRDARMYNFDIKSSSDESSVQRVMELIDQYVPEKHTARATTGSLCKLLLWNEEQSLVDDNGEVKEVLQHQSDFASMSLMKKGLDVSSDWHNVLKLGYDVRNREFPSWMIKLLKEGCGISNPESVLPSKVISPGEPFGVISSTVATKYGLSPNCLVVGGTTDSNAAFFAAAGAQPDFGTAVTSLGSTLAMKQLSKTFVEDASRGVYSHRFPRFGNNSGEDQEAWLIGGASNVGCAILRQEDFSDDELVSLSAEIDPNSDSTLSYYPLMKKGERFPVADSAKEPVLDPKPESGSREEYLHGILQGISDVEREGFKVLGDLGASPDRPSIVLTCGGGSKNDMWIQMRERRLKDICNEHVEVKRAINTEASYGAALLAAASFGT